MHRVESCRSDKPRNILQILSSNTRRTKVVELSAGTHRCAGECGWVGGRDLAGPTGGRGGWGWVWVLVGGRRGRCCAPFPLEWRVPLHCCGCRRWWLVVVLLLPRHHSGPGGLRHRELAAEAPPAMPRQRVGGLWAALCCKGRAADAMPHRRCLIRVADELRRHSLTDGEGGHYSTNLDRNRYGSDNNYLFTGGPARTAGFMSWPACKAGNGRGREGGAGGRGVGAAVHMAASWSSSV